MTVIPLHPENPGHYFACMGLLYCADRVGPAMGRFTKHGFEIRADLDAVFDAIHRYRVIPGGIAPESPIFVEGIGIHIDFWDPPDRRPKLKLFAGRQTGRKIVKDLLENARGLGVEDFLAEAPGLPTGFDMDTSWTAGGDGFSLNILPAGSGKEKMNKFVKTLPLVELFAHFGAQTACFGVAGPGLFRYCVWQEHLSFPLARMVGVGALNLGCVFAEYRFKLASSGRYKVIYRT